MKDSQEDDQHRESEFFELGETFRASNDPDEIQRLGDDLGRAIFGT